MFEGQRKPAPFVERQDHDLGGGLALPYLAFIERFCF